ncbi:FadR/GntR family transcriptional regulator [Desulfobaculum sp. SPO524]|uniref:FadR/GntR family transcriptional regulator n=1 Tax=Desulfobaculum sp. SPO524 TaxID=3378071 RepID=UPI0038545D10
MQLAQKNSVCEKIAAMIQSNRFSKGDRLPGERRLAELFGTSRNTIREALCNLETMGYVEIRRRSGCYVKNPQGRLSWEALRTGANSRMAGQLLEAFSVTVPGLVRRAAAHHTASDIDKLEHATARLGRAIVNRDMENVARQYIGFFLSVAETTGNDFLTLLLRELATAAEGLSIGGTGLSEVVVDALFASHVELINAIRTGNMKEAASLAESCIDTFSRLVLAD